MTAPTKSCCSLLALEHERLCLPFGSIRGVYFIFSTVELNINQLVTLFPISSNTSLVEHG